MINQMKFSIISKRRGVLAGLALWALVIVMAGGLAQAAAGRAASAAGAEGVRAGAAQAQTLVYEVYAGGVNAVTATLALSEAQAERYDLSLRAQTKGFLGRLVPWQGLFETKGWRFEDGTQQPELHRSMAVWRGEKEVKTYHYDRDGRFKDLTITEAGTDKSPARLDSALTDGTIDALTATLNVMAYAGAGESCNSSSDVFDGKRRFELAFRHEADETLRSSRYNIYDGQAMRCVVEVHPVAGKWHEKPRGWMSIQEQGRDKGSLPTIWIAKMAESGLAVPVKIRVKTNYGTLFMHLTEYRSGDHVIKTEER